jgi:hypothetical protein
LNFIWILCTFLTYHETQFQKPRRNGYSITVILANCVSHHNELGELWHRTGGIPDRGVQSLRHHAEAHPTSYPWLSRLSRGIKQQSLLQLTFLIRVSLVVDPQHCNEGNEGSDRWSDLLPWHRVWRWVRGEERKKRFLNNEWKGVVNERTNLKKRIKEITKETIKRKQTENETNSSQRNRKQERDRTDFMDQSPAWDANSRLASQQIPPYLRIQKVQCCVHYSRCCLPWARWNHRRPRPRNTLRPDVLTAVNITRC